MSTFDQCKLRFYLKYIAKIQSKDETTDWYADYGTAFHEVAQECFRKSKSEIKKELMSSMAQVDIPEQNKAEYFEGTWVGLDMLMKLKEDKEVEILGTEVEFSVPVSFGMPPLTGFIDVVYKKNGNLYVIDYKSSKPFPPKKMSEQYQPYFYAEGCKSIFGEYPKAFEFWFFRHNKIKKVTIDEGFMKLQGMRVQKKWVQMSKLAGAEMPEGNYQPFFCNNFCDLRSYCPIYNMKEGFE
jgi:hypothetical protein